VGDFYTGTIYVLSRSGGVAADATQLPDAHFGAFDLASLSFGWGGVLYASLWGPGQRAAQPELVELDPATGAEVRIIARAADGLAGCPGRAVADPLDGYLFVPGNCYRGAFSAGAIDRISSPSSANPDVSTFARLPAPVAGLTFAPDGALYAETGPGAGPASGSGPSSGSAQVVQVAGPGTVLISPPTLVGDISGGLGSGVAVSAADHRGHASALEAPNREDGIYTFALSRLPAVPHRDVHSGPAPGAGPTAGFGWGVTWHRGCLYFADGAVIERAWGSPPGSLSTIASSLPSPSRAFRPFASDAIDALIAAAVALLVSFAAGTVNNALADGCGDIFVRRARWSSSPRRRLLTRPGKRRLTRPGKRRLTGPGKRWAWAALFGAAVFVLVQLVLRPISGPGGRSDLPLMATLSLLVLSCAGSVLLRDRLSRQHHREQRAGSVPASPQEASGPPDSVLVSGARD
jgi:hypothetical protein